MSVNKTQIAVLSGAVVLFVLLLFANTTIPANKEKSGMSDHAGNNNAVSINTLLEQAKKALSADQQQTITKLEKNILNAADKKKAFANMVSQWDTLRQPAIAAYYLEQAAIAMPEESNWYKAGNRYYMAGRFAKEAERPTIYLKAIECFEKTLALNAHNIDAKIDMAACYVEGTPEPMKGIGLLREVEQTDSNNVKLQITFAMFSEKSGQWDRAIARFQKVLKIQPDYIEVYPQLANVYEQKGDKVKAIENLEKYASLVDDAAIKNEIQNYINKLKN